nr:RNA-directed DNA polymerase, eukaryota, reverse transcriptase zinc-binding domain protein [Tanacetum cinerariifolium]
MLWDYLSFLIGNWDGKVVIMGDFNEVHDISERFVSIFNKHGAEAFNSFIVNAGLMEVPLGGCAFTWCHKSAKKMSKLDRFLIFDNLMRPCPSISSTSLDRFLSDHRPIIMREAHYDYGPILFKFFRYWFELDGFDKLVEQTWLEVNVNDQNSYSKFMNKLKYLKEKIRIWARLHKESLNSRKSILKAELADLDGVIDKGEGSDADGHRRREVVRLIQEVEKVDVMEVAQKAKIKWSIEGDENSKYYHGVLNKKRGRLTIHGILVNGIWMESPHLVKHKFFEHFKNRFEKPNKSRILLERDFVKRISLEQNDDLEREVSNEEIKRAVWDCGIDKAPRPDGFTFGFYRRYWYIIGNDVVDVVKWVEESQAEVNDMVVEDSMMVEEIYDDVASTDRMDDNGYDAIYVYERKLPSDYYNWLVYDLHEGNKALKRKNKMSGVKEDSSKRLPTTQTVRCIEKDNTDKSIKDDYASDVSYSSKSKSEGNNLLVGKKASQKVMKNKNAEDTRDLSYTPKSYVRVANGKTWDEIVEKLETRKLEIGQTKERAKQRFEIDVDVYGYWFMLLV